MAMRAANARKDDALPIADARSAAELRQLIALLERSGMAEKRADARALLESSRALLHAPVGGRPAPSPRRVLAKLLALCCLGLDGVAMAAFCAGVAGWLAGTLPRPVALGLLLVGPAWAILRAAALRAWLVEAALIAAYHARWGWDWFAEAFSPAAQLRLEARLAAREVMWLWRRHRRGLLHRPGLADVEEFLHRTHGPAARAAFSAVVAAQRQDGRGGRLTALRWLALIQAFEGLPAPAVQPSAPAPLVLGESAPLPAARPPAPPMLPALPENPARIQRRIDLRELIRRKREDVTTAYGWKLKTPAEIAQREQRVDELRAEIAALERELTAIDA